MKGISRAAFAALFLVIILYPSSAFAACVKPSSGFANLLDIICVLIGLLGISLFFDKRRAWKRVGQRIKFGWLLFGVFFICLPVITFASVMLFSPQGRERYGIYPCCPTITPESKFVHMSDSNCFCRTCTPKE